MNRKTVFTKDQVSIVRVQSYGFGCNTISTSWEIYVDGKQTANCIRLKDAKKLIALLFSV